MKIPYIVTSKYDVTMDPGINSKLLRAIFKIMKVGYNEGVDGFTSDFPWRVKVTDQHDDECKPHYVLEVGEGAYDERESNIYTVRYCDYHSYGKHDINIAPGEWTIEIWLPRHAGVDVDQAAEYISTAYAKAMEEELPAYEIIHQEVPSKRH